MERVKESGKNLFLSIEALFWTNKFTMPNYFAKVKICGRFYEGSNFGWASCFAGVKICRQFQYSNFLCLSIKKKSTERSFLLLLLSFHSFCFLFAPSVSLIYNEKNNYVLVPSIYIHYWNKNNRHDFFSFVNFILTLTDTTDFTGPHWFYHYYWSSNIWVFLTLNSFFAL